MQTAVPCAPLFVQEISLHTLGKNWICHFHVKLINKMTNNEKSNMKSFIDLEYGLSSKIEYAREIAVF